MVKSGEQIMVLHFYFVTVIAFGVVLHMLESDSSQLLVATC